MNRKPWGLYIFQSLLVAAAFILMLLLYWSNLLIEEDIKAIRASLSSISEEIKTIQRAPKQAVEPPKLTSSQPASSHVDPNSPNLLKEDNFYSKILPEKLLPQHFVPYGTRKDDTIGKPDSLHPFTNLLPFANFVNQCGVSLATQEFGKFETLAPSLAVKMELKNGNEFWIELRDNVFWQPLDPAFFHGDFNLSPHFLKKQLVTAHDIKFGFDATMNPFVQESGAVASRNYMNEIEEITVLDDLHLIVKWKTQNVDGAQKIKYAAKSITGSLRPLARFVYQYFPDGTKIVEDDEDPSTYRTNSVWAEQFSKHWAKNIIVSCGPWTFDGLSDTQIRFKRTEDYFSPYEVLVEKMQVTFRDSQDGLWQDFKAGATDMYSVDAPKVLEVKDFLDSQEYQKEKNAGNGVSTIEYVNRAFAYVGWNMNRPIFSSNKVRRALTLAINRERIIAQNLNGMGQMISSPFSIDSPAYDESLKPLPYDPESAKALLEEEGWVDLDGDGILDKEIDGKVVPFRFFLSYYVNNQVTKINCESIRSFLKDVGIDCRLNALDIADIMGIVDDKDFDAVYFAWSSGTPPEDPKQLWHSSGAKEKGSSNFVGFENQEADKIIESLLYEYNLDKRIELYHKFGQILHEEQPYTLLYAPKVKLLYRDYVQNIFIPKDRQDLIPGADISQPDLGIIWLKKE